jgi:hypothetical protein
VHHDRLAGLSRDGAQEANDADGRDRLQRKRP